MCSKTISTNILNFYREQKNKKRQKLKRLKKGSPAKLNLFTARGIRCDHCISHWKRGLTLHMCSAKLPVCTSEKTHLVYLERVSGMIQLLVELADSGLSPGSIYRGSWQYQQWLPTPLCLCVRGHGALSLGI